MVAGGISFEPSLAVNAHPVQHSDEAIEYQNHLILSVFDTAERSLMSLSGRYAILHGLLELTGGRPGGSVAKESDLG